MRASFPRSRAARSRIVSSPRCSPVAGAGSRSSGIEPASVVDDRQTDAIAVEVQRDVNVRRAAMPDRVGDRLLRNSQKLHVGIT